MFSPSPCAVQPERMLTDVRYMPIAERLRAVDAYRGHLVRLTTDKRVHVGYVITVATRYGAPGHFVVINEAGGAFTPLAYDLGVVESIELDEVAGDLSAASSP